MYLVNENIDISWAVPAISNIEQYIEKCSKVVICMAAPEHLHFRQVCVAHEITVKQINQYSSVSLNYSAHRGQGSASDFCFIPHSIISWCKRLKDAEQFVDVSVTGHSITSDSIFIVSTSISIKVAVLKS